MNQALECYWSFVASHTAPLFSVFSIHGH